MSNTTRKRRRAYWWGVTAEWLAAVWLVAHGYRLRAHRYKTPYGEVDLIASKGGVCAFIEVKARPGEAESLEAITYRQRLRIERAAMAFLHRHPRAATLSMRFDVIACAPWSLPRHLPDAWRPGG